MSTSTTRENPKYKPFFIEVVSLAYGIVIYYENRNMESE